MSRRTEKFGAAQRSLLTSHRLATETTAEGLIRLSVHEAGPATATRKLAAGYATPSELRAIAAMLMEAATEADTQPA